MVASKQGEDIQVENSRLGEEKVLFSWESVERPFKKWGKELYSTIMVLAVLVSIIFFFIEGLMLVLVVWAVVFMAWSVYRTEPGKGNHQLTSLGIRTGENLYYWEEMIVFWLEEKWGNKLLRVLLRRFPGQLILVYEGKDEKEIKEIMSRYLPLEKPKDSWTDKLVKWFGEKVPLE